VLDMKKLYSLKYAWLIYLFLLIVVSAVEGNASGMVGTWEPFKAKTELGLYVAGVDADRIPSAWDEFIQTDKIISIDGDRSAAERKGDSSLNVLRFHNVSISLSRALLDQLQVDIRQPSGSGVDKLSAIKSLPTTFLNSSYGDTFQSLGKIFEPQVNLSIEF
jgi:hypothetical protein